MNNLFGSVDPFQPIAKPQVTLMTVCESGREMNGGLKFYNPLECRQFEETVDCWHLTFTMVVTVAYLGFFHGGGDMMLSSKAKDLNLGLPKISISYTAYGRRIDSLGLSPLRKYATEQIWLEVKVKSGAVIWMY